MEWIELQGPSSLAHSSRVHGHEISRVADGGGGVQPPGRGYGGGEGLGVAGGVRAPAAGPRHHQHAAPEDAHVLEEGGRVVEVAEHDADVLTALQRLLNCRAIAIIIREDEVQECGRRVAALPPTAVHLQTLHLQSSGAGQQPFEQTRAAADADHIADAEATGRLPDERQDVPGGLQP